MNHLLLLIAELPPTAFEIFLTLVISIEKYILFVLSNEALHCYLRKGLYSVLTAHPCLVLKRQPTLLHTQCVPHIVLVQGIHL